MTRTLDVNADVGEGFGHDAALMRHITSANVACGFHAGDAETMAQTCALAVAHGVAIGAQVSYRDREGFGRRDRDVAPRRLLADILEQVEALRAAAQRAGGRVRYLKPHGALYNRVVWDHGQAAVVAEAARVSGLPVLGLPGSTVLDLAHRSGVGAFLEFFADRAYDVHGRLVSRASDGAVITDASVVAQRVRRLVADGVVESADGDVLAMEAHSICVHGDTEGAVELARAVRESLAGSGCDVAAFS